MDHICLYIKQQNYKDFERPYREMFCGFELTQIFKWVWKLILAKAKRAANLMLYK